MRNTFVLGITIVNSKKVLFNIHIILSHLPRNVDTILFGQALSVVQLVKSIVFNRELAVWYPCVSNIMN